MHELIQHHSVMSVGETRTPRAVELAEPVEQGDETIGCLGKAGSYRVVCVTNTTEWTDQRRAATGSGRPGSRGGVPHGELIDDLKEAVGRRRWTRRWKPISSAMRSRPAGTTVTVTTASEC